MKNIILFISLIFSVPFCMAQESIETSSQYPTGYIKATNPYHFGTIDGVLYIITGNKPYTLVKYPPNDQRDSFIIPNTVTRIAKGAFKGSRNLKELILPETIYYIGENAFDDSEIEIFTVVSSNGVFSLLDEDQDNQVFYNLGGIQMNTPGHGINIVTQNGTSKKIYVK